MQKSGLIVFFDVPETILESSGGGANNVTTFVDSQSFVIGILELNLIFIGGSIST